MVPISCIIPVHLIDIIKLNILDYLKKLFWFLGPPAMFEDTDPNQFFAYVVGSFDYFTWYISASASRPFYENYWYCFHMTFFFTSLEHSLPEGGVKRVTVHESQVVEWINT